MRRITLLTLILIICTAGVSYGRVYTLNDIVKEAISNNYLIKVAKENLIAARFKYKSSTANLFPKVDFSYSYTRLRNYPYTIFFNNKIKVGNRNNIKWYIQMTQPIFTGFAISTEREIAKLGVNLGRIYRQEAVLNIAENAKIAYFNILLAEKYLDVANEAVRQLEAHERDAEKLYREEMIPLNDLLKSKVALANAIQDRVRAQNNLKIAFSALSVVLDKNIGTHDRLEDFDFLKEFNEPLSKLIAVALKKRPLLKALSTQIKQQLLGVKLARSNYYPHVGFFAQYEQMGKDIFANTNDYGNNHNAMFGIKISWKIFDSFKTHYDIEEAYHKAFALQERINQIKNRVKFQVRQAYLDLQTAKDNIQTAVTGLRQAKENFRVTNIRYKENLTTSTDVLDARTYLTQAEMNYYSALYGYYIALAKLKRAIGEY